MRRFVGFLAFVAGCDFTFNLDHIKDPPIDGALADGDAELMDAPGCFGRYGAGNAGLAQICLDQAPMDTWTSNGELHTGMFSELGDCQMKVSQNGVNTDLCVIAAKNITLGGYLPTSGNRPIVFVATDTFTLLEGATIAADTRRNGGRRGAGSNESDCAATQNGTDAVTGGSGGAGGSFATRGGNGGKGFGTTPGAGANQALSGVGFVRGGCRGGTGGSGTIGGTSTGDGGTSGGAVYVIAGKRISILGTIDASGEAGAGGIKASSTMVGGDAGGGGGSGGLIGLDSPVISIAATAILVANGGGGGGGGSGNSSGTAGVAGTEAQLTVPPSFPAPGGAGGSANGDGGSGASGTAASGPGQPAGTNAANSAGGGGGGGAGIIKFFSSGPIEVLTTSISPPQS